MLAAPDVEGLNPDAVALAELDMACLPRFRFLKDLHDLFLAVQWPALSNKARAVVERVDREGPRYEKC